jgi:hypothetical protein
MQASKYERQQLFLEIERLPDSPVSKLGTEVEKAAWRRDCHTGWMAAVQEKLPYGRDSRL